MEKSMKQEELMPFFRFKEFLRCNLSTIEMTEEGFKTRYEPQILLRLVPQDMQRATMEEVYRHLYEERVFEPIMDLIREQRSLEQATLKEERMKQRQEDHLLQAIAPCQKEDFTADQLVIIEKGLAMNLPVGQYAWPSYSTDTMEKMKEALEQGYDFSLYDGRFREEQLQEIAKGMIRGIDYSAYAYELFTKEQMQEIRMGLEEFVDIQEYAFPNFEPERMKAVREELRREGSRRTDSEKTQPFIEELHYYNREVDGSPVAYGIIRIKEHSVVFSESENSGDIFPSSDNFDELGIDGEGFHQIVVKAIEEHESMEASVEDHAM